MCDSNIKYVSEKLYDRYIKYAVFELEIWKVETGHLSAIMIFRHFNCHLLLFAAAGSGLLFSSTTFYICLCAYVFIVTIFYLIGHEHYFLLLFFELFIVL